MALNTLKLQFTDLLFSCPSQDISGSGNTGSGYAVACRRCSSSHLGTHTAALCVQYAWRNLCNLRNYQTHRTIPEYRQQPM